MSISGAERLDRRPYVGPRAFEATDGWRFFGREREIADLRDILIASRIILLYSPSGAGKTSLLKAALIPHLEKAGFHVLPVIRLNHPPDTSSTSRYIASTLVSLEETLSEEQKIPREQLATLDLVSYLDQRLHAAEADDAEVLVFDQFEEILTQDPNDIAAKTEFFRQVGIALRNRRRWAIFAMREDYVAGLDPYRRYVPMGLSTTFRLDLLGTHAAMEAIQKPAHECGVHFSDEAARQLVGDLSEGGQYVEPVQLQVVCRRLWNHLLPGTTEIRASDTSISSTNVDSALAEYYDESVAAVAASVGISELVIREWVDTQLISQQGIRGMVLLEPETSQGLENRAIRGLVDAHLLRTEKRRGATWVELAHDRLVGPIQNSNRDWTASNLSPWQRQAMIWEEEGRSTHLLLSGAMLHDAEQWAQANRGQVKQVERDFLNTSRVARSAARNRMWRWGTLATILLAIVLFSLTWEASTQRDVAEAQRANAEAEANAAATSEAEARAARATAEWQADVSRVRSLAAQAPDQYEVGEDERGALLAVEAYQLDQENGGASHAQVDNALRTVLGRGGIGKSLPHNNPVKDVAFSPDGSTLATSTYGEVWLWDVATGAPRGEPLLQADNWVYTVAFSPDGAILAVGTGVPGVHSGGVRLWDVATGQPRGAPLAHDNRVNAVAFSPDGATLATGSDDGTARLWDVATGQPRGAPLAHDGLVNAVAFSPDGATLATGGQDGLVRFWHVATGALRGEPLSHDGLTVYAVAFSPDGAHLVTGTSETWLWDLTQPGAERRVLPHDDWVNAVAFSPDGTTLATGSENRTVRLWDVVTGQPRGAPLAHDGLVNAVAFSPDGATLATGGEDRTVRLWDLTAWKGDPRILSHGGYTVFATAFSPDGATLATGSDDGTARLWDLTQPGAEPRALPHDDWVNAVAFSPDGTTLATGTYGEVRLWDVATGERHGEPLPQGNNWVYTVAFSPDGTTLATGTYGEVRLWDLTQPGAEPRVLRHDDWVNAVAFSPDGATLATGTFRAALFWDLTQPGAEPRVLPHDGWVNAVAFSPDGTTLATGGEDRTVRLWDLTQPGAEPRVLPHDGWVYTVAFSPDGATLATGTFRAALFWDLTQPGAEPRVLRHDGWVNAVAFSPDGATLATGTFRAALLWTVDTGELAERVCQVVRRNLTGAEWERFLGSDIPYRQTCPDLPPGDGAPGSEAAQEAAPAASPAATPADAPGSGLIGKGEYVSPQYWVGINWTDAWEVGDLGNPHVEFAIPDEYDDPIVSISGADAIFLMDSESGSGVLSIAINRSYGTTLAREAEAMRSPAYLEDNLFVSPESDILLLEQTETAAALLVRDADNPDHLAYVEVLFPPGETYFVFVGVDLWEPDAYAQVLGAVEADLEIAGVDLFSVTDLTTLLDRIDAAMESHGASMAIAAGTVRATPLPASTAS